MWRGLPPHPDHKAHPPRQNRSALSLVDEYSSTGNEPASEWRSVSKLQKRLSVETFPIATGYAPTIPPTRTTYLPTPKKKKDPVGEKGRGEKWKQGRCFCSRVLYDPSAHLGIVEKLAGLRICVLSSRAYFWILLVHRSCILSIRAVSYRSELGAVISL